MSDETSPRVVIVMPNWRDERGLFPERNVREVEARLKSDILSWVKLHDPSPERLAAANFRMDYLASNMPVRRGIEIPAQALRSELVCGLIMDDEAAVAALAPIIRNVYDDDRVSIGADLPVFAAGCVERDRFWTHWCPGEASFGLFGDRAAALRAMGGVPAPGRSAVNIVFVDTGLPAWMRPPPSEFQGWDVAATDASGTITVRKPGEPLTDHGAMVARNARAIASAPNVRLLDCPAIPDGIMNLPEFLGLLVGVVRFVKVVVKARQDALAGAHQPPESWVICNAWGVYDPTRESPIVPYADNPGHPLAIAYRELAALGTDIVFAAGNCGAFCPSHRCSPIHIGPGRSIHGVNAMAEVLTVGAVRSDGLWLGYSAQGPGITNMAHDKPDLCTPSQFEDDDGFGPNTGTSAACGLAAGAVALLRTRASTLVDPSELRAILRDTAAQPYGPDWWQDRTGHGVIDMGAAAAKLPVA